MFPVCLPPRLSPPLVLQPSLVVPSGEGPLHLPSPGCTTLYSKMMSLRIPSRGPLSAHKTVFLQLNTYGLSAFQLLLYHSPPNPNPPFVSFPFLSQSKKKANYRKQGTSPNRPQAVNIPTALSNASHRCSTRVSGKEKTRTFQLQREWKKGRAEEKKAKEMTGGESDIFLETWSQVWQTVLCLHDIMHRYSLSAFAGCWATETCAKKRKIKWKLSLRLVWKRLEQADVIVWYNSILNEM